MVKISVNAIKALMRDSVLKDCFSAVFAAASEDLVKEGFQG